MHPLPLRNPAGSSFSFLSIASVILWMMILLEIDRRVIPHPLLQSLKARFLASWIIMPIVQSLGIFIPSHIDVRFSAVSS